MMGLYMLFDMAVREWRMVEKYSDELTSGLTQEVDTQVQLLNVVPFRYFLMMMCHKEINVVREPTVT